MTFTVVEPPTVETELVLGLFDAGEVIALFHGEGEYAFVKNVEMGYYEIHQNAPSELRVKYDYSLGIGTLEELR